MTTLTLGLKAVTAINQQTSPDQTITTRSHFRREILDQNEGNNRSVFKNIEIKNIFVFIYITLCFGYKTLNIYIDYMMLKCN